MAKKKSISKEDLRALHEAYNPQGKADWKTIDENFEHTVVGNPVILKILIILGSQIAAAALIGFLALMDLFDNKESQFALGLIFLGGGLGLPFIKKRSDFLEPFALTCAIVGLSVLTISFANAMHYDEVEMAGVGLIISIALWLITRSALQQYGFFGLFMFCIAVLMWEAKSFNMIHVLVGLCAALMTFLLVHEAELLSSSKRLAGRMNAMIASSATVLGLLLLISVNKETFDGESFGNWWASSIMLTGLLAYSAYTVVKKSGMKISPFVAIVIALLMGASCLLAPGIIASVLLILLAHYTARYLLLTAGTISLIGFTISFYYNLNISLLNKSIMLMVSGVLFIGIFAGMHYWSSKKSDS